MTLTYIRPDADDTDGTWTNEAESNSNLFASIDETVANDTDYIKSAHLPDHDICKIRLSDPAFITMRPATVHYRFKKRGETTQQINLDVSILQGTTEIAKWTETDISTSYVDGSQALTLAQFNSITDFTNLFIQFDASSSWWLVNSEIDLYFSGNKYHLSTALSSASFLMHADGADASTTFIDATGRHQIAVAGSAQIDTAQSKFGGASLLASTNADYLTLSASNTTDFVFGTGDFTIDCWLRINSTGAFHIIYSTRDGGAEISQLFGVNNSDKLFYQVNGSVVITGTTSLTTGAWYHVAVARSGSSSKLFLNGTQEGSTYSASDNLVVLRGPFVGLDDIAHIGCDGWIDEFRILKGTAAWTTTFTPPTAPYNVALSGPYAHLSCSRASIGYAKTSSGTLTSFASNALRITDLGLLVEDARTNLFTNSQSTTGWSTFNTTLTNNSDVAPDGTTTAFEVANTSTTCAANGSSTASSPVAVATYTWSIYAKAKVGSSGWCYIFYNQNSTPASGTVWFNLLTGALGSHSAAGASTYVDSSIEALANNWYRLIMTFSITNTTGAGNINIEFHGGVSADGGAAGQTSGDKFALWGQQMEAGSFPSSYIPTTSAAATRAADVINLIGNAAFIGMDTPQSGVVDAIASRVGISPLITDNGSNSFWRLSTYNDNSVNQNNAATAILGSGLWSTGAKGGWSKREGTDTTFGSVVGGGGSVVAGAPAGAFNSNIARLGPNIGYGDPWFGYYRRITLWNSRLADATLQTLTDPAHTTNFTTDAATIDLDFANAAYNAITLPTDFLICSRASVGYAQTVAGVLQQFGANQLRITDKGLLVEDARTNEVPHSQDFGNGFWTATANTVSNTFAAPDGTTNAQKFIPDTTPGQWHDVQGAVGTTAQNYTASIYVKAAEYSFAFFRIISNGGTDGAFACNVNLTTGAITSTDGSFTGSAALLSNSVETLGNGWFRIIISFTATAGSAYSYFGATNTSTPSWVGGRPAWAGDGTSGVYFFGMQLEAGAFPSSYIPTTSGSATRAADAVIFMSTLQTIANAATMSTVIDIKGVTTPDSIFMTNNAGTQVFFQYRATNTLRSWNNSTALDVTIGNSLTAETGYKAGFAQDGTGRSLVAGGGTVGTDANTVAMTTTTQINGPDGSHISLFGYFRRITAWTTRLADATLQGFTNP